MPKTKVNQKTKMNWSLCKYSGLTPAMGRIVKRVEKPFLLKASSLCFLLSLCLFAADLLDRLLWWSAGRETWLNLLSVQPKGVPYIISKTRGAHGDHSLKRAIKDPGVSTVPLRSKICGGKVIQ